MAGGPPSPVGVVVAFGGLIRAKVAHEKVLPRTGGGREGQRPRLVGGERERWLAGEWREHEGVIVRWDVIATTSLTEAGAGIAVEFLSRDREGQRNGGIHK